MAPRCRSSLLSSAQPSDCAWTFPGFKHETFCRTWSRADGASQVGDAGTTGWTSENRSNGTHTSHDGCFGGSAQGDRVKPSPHIRATKGSRGCNACRGWTQAGGALTGLEGARSFKSLCLLSPYRTSSTRSSCLKGLHSATGRQSLSCSAREEPADGQKGTQQGWGSWAQQGTEVP